MTALGSPASVAAVALSRQGDQNLLPEVHELLSEQ